MVLELKVPRDTTLTSLPSLAPQFLSYVFSFLVVAIMWVNHRHLLHAARHADARLLWANNNQWSQSLAAGCLTVCQEGRVQLPLRPPQG